MLLIGESPVAHADLAVVACTVIPVLFIGALVAVPAHIFAPSTNEPLSQKLLGCYSAGLAILLLVFFFALAVIAMYKSVFSLAGDGLTDGEAAFVSISIVVLFVVDALLALIRVVSSAAPNTAAEPASTAATRELDPSEQNHSDPMSLKNPYGLS